MNGICDLCVALANYRVPVSIDRSPVRTLDLCEMHYDQLIEPVVQAVDQYGQRPVRVVKGEPVRNRQGWRRQHGPFKCRIEGCVSTPLKHAGTLETHLRLLHGGMLLEYYFEKYGRETATPEELAEPVTVECDQPDCETVYSTLTGSRWPQQAMISHMRGRHALDWRPNLGVIGTVGK